MRVVTNWLGRDQHEAIELENLTIYENIALVLTVKTIPKEKIGPTIQSLSEKFGILSILGRR